MVTKTSLWDLLQTVTFRADVQPFVNSYTKWIVDKYTVKHLIRTDIPDGQIPMWFVGISTFPTTIDTSYSAAAFYVWYHAVTTALNDTEAHEIQHVWNGRPGVEWEGRISDIVQSLWPDAVTKQIQVISGIFRNKNKQNGRNVANLHNGRAKASLWWLGENYEYSKTAKVNYLDLELVDPTAVKEMDVVSAYPEVIGQIITYPIPGETVVKMVEEAEKDTPHTEPVHAGDTAVPQPTVVEGMPQDIIDAMQRAWKDLQEKALGPDQKDELRRQMVGIDQSLRLVMGQFSELAEMIEAL
jgi:hypothetical protein